MIELNFTIENQILSRKDIQVIVNKSKNYVTCNFEFKTDDWIGIPKFVIFKNEDDQAYEVLLGSECNCSCIIPSPVLTGNYFLITVYGGDLITTIERKIVLLESGYTKDISSISDSDKDIFIQLYELYEDIENKADINDISAVGKTGSYCDLENIPEQFTPSPHTHDTSDITDFEEKTGLEIKRAYTNLANKIRTYGE